MTVTHIPTVQQVKPRRRWNRHSFYLSDQMANIAAELARREQERTGRQVGSGQIVDRAMRRYVAELLTPEELAQLFSGRATEAGK